MAFETRDASGDVFGNPHATPLHADENQRGHPGVPFDDLMRYARQCATHIRGRKNFGPAFSSHQRYEATELPCTKKAPGAAQRVIPNVSMLSSRPSLTGPDLRQERVYTDERRL